MNTMELAMTSPFNFILLLQGNKITKEDFLQTRMWEQEDRKEFFNEILNVAGRILRWLPEEDLYTWKFSNFRTAMLIESRNNINLFKSFREIVEFILAGETDLIKISSMTEYALRRFGDLHLPALMECSIKLFNYIEQLDLNPITDNKISLKKSILDSLIAEYQEHSEFLYGILTKRINISFVDFIKQRQNSQREESIYDVANRVYRTFLRNSYDMSSISQLLQQNLEGSDFEQFFTDFNELLNSAKIKVSPLFNDEKDADLYAVQACIQKDLSEYQPVLMHVLFSEKQTTLEFLKKIALYLGAYNNAYSISEKNMRFVADAVIQEFPEESFAKKLALCNAASNNSILIQGSWLSMAAQLINPDNTDGLISFEEFKDVLTEYWALPCFNENKVSLLFPLSSLVRDAFTTQRVVEFFLHIKQIWTNKADSVILSFISSMVGSNMAGSDFLLKFENSEQVWVNLKDIISDFAIAGQDKYSDKSALIKYLEKVPSRYKEQITKRHKEVNEISGFKVNPLTALHALVYEHEFIKHCILSLESPEKCHEVATEKSAAIRGGFDSFNIVGNRAALMYSVSKRIETNLFVVPKKIKREVFMLEMNKEGIPGLEQVNPFERGFSWANFDEICNLAQINPYGNKNAAKRFACYLLTAIFRDEPVVLNNKFKEAGFTDGIKDAADAIAQVIPHSALVSTQPPIFLKNIFENREIWCEYWSNKHEHIKLILAFNSVFVNSGKILAPNVLAQMAQVVQSFKDQGLESYLEQVFEHIDDVNITLKNGTTMSTVTTALEFVRHNEKPAKKTIEMEPVSVESENISARILQEGDLRALTIGEEVSCCQHIRGHARTCAEETYTNPDYCILLVEDTTKQEPTIPVAESALWVSNNTIVIDSIESRRSDHSAVNKVGLAFELAIKQWLAKGLKVALSQTNYGMTTQVRSWLENRFNLVQDESPAKFTNAYSDVGHYCMYVQEK